jgi:hypothetical protein
MAKVVDLENGQIREYLESTAQRTLIPVKGMRGFEGIDYVRGLRQDGQAGLDGKAFYTLDFQKKELADQLVETLETHLGDNLVVCIDGAENAYKLAFPRKHLHDVLIWCTTLVIQKNRPSR